VPLWHVTSQIITDYHKNEALSLMKCIRRYLIIRSFWSWLAVNRSTFDENMREKRFLHFRFQRPLPFRSHFVPLVTHLLLSSAIFPLCFYGFPISRKSEARDGWTNKWGATLAPKKGCIKLWIHQCMCVCLKNQQL